MSNYECLQGDIKLPSAEFTRMRKVFELETKKRQEATFERTQVFWKGLTRKQQTDPTEYNKARREYIDKMYASTRSTGYGWNRSTDDSHVDEFEEATGLKAQMNPTTRQWETLPPKRVQKADIDWANNRTTRFTCGESGVYFDRETSNVRYSSGENHHAVDRATDQWLTPKFVEEIKKCRWSRDTGGVLYYKSEYQEDGYQPSAGYGPRGFSEPTCATDYVDTKGVKHSARANVEAHFKAQAKAAEAYRKAFAAETGAQGRRGNGEFDFKSHSRPSRGLGY